METILSAIKIAFGAILTNKTRSFLTMLGVIIGVGSVILLTSIGNGLQAYVVEQFNSFGATNLYIFPGDIFGEGGGFNAEAQQAAFTTNKLTMRDIEEIKRLREYVVDAAPEYIMYSTVSYADNQKKTTIYGTTASFFNISNTKMSKGRPFSEAEDSTGARVAVLGSEIKKKLFDDSDAIGKRIRVGSQIFQVVGVAESRGGGFGGPNLDSYIYSPISLVMRLNDGKNITQITAKVVSREKMEDAIAAIKKLMGKKFKKDEFSVIDQKQILQTINQILSVLTVGLGGIAAISLVVGGIGILNIMLVSVIERTREIGLRKALGATPNVILIQFLIESATISVVGGMIGTGLAYGITLIIKRFIPASVTPEAVALAFGVSAAIGIIFGVIPARRASKLSPIEALRSE